MTTGSRLAGSAVAQLPMSALITKENHAMPNWCSNYVTIVHDDIQKMNELLFVIERAKQAKEHAEGFFQQIVPMPAELLDDDRPGFLAEFMERFLDPGKRLAIILK